MVEEKRRAVIGSYNNVNDAIAELKRLKAAGYQRKDVHFYTNEHSSDTLKSSLYIDVKTETVEVAEPIGDDNRSFWENIKDEFSVITYDFNTESQEASYNQQTDILYPYRDDLSNGYIVIVVDDYRGETD